MGGTNAFFPLRDFLGKQEVYDVIPQGLSRGNKSSNCYCLLTSKVYLQYLLIKFVVKDLRGRMFII